MYSLSGKLKVIAFLRYWLIEVELSVAKSGTLYELCSDWDTTGQDPKFQDCPGDSGTVGNYAIFAYSVLSCIM